MAHAGERLEQSSVVLVIEVNVFIGLDYLDSKGLILVLTP